MRGALENCKEETVKLSEQIVELNREKEKLGKDLTKFEGEIMDLGVQPLEYHTKCKTLSCKNDLLHNKLDEFTMRNHKGKSKRNMIQFQLEEELTETKTNIDALLKKNLVLEKELV